MSIVSNFVKYKIFGALSLFLGIEFLITKNTKELALLQRFVWVVIILVLALIQLYGNFILMWIEPTEPKEIKNKKKNENEPLINEEFPVTKLVVKEMKKLNSELKAIKNNEDDKKKILFFDFRNEINEMKNNLEVENII